MRGKVKRDLRVLVTTLLFAVAAGDLWLTRINYLNYLDATALGESDPQAVTMVITALEGAK